VLRRHPVGRPLAVLVATLAIAAPAAAQQATPEANQQANQQRQKAVEGQLDAATATEQQLTSELTRLDTEVKGGEARVANARARQAEAERQVETLRSQVAEAEAAAETARKAAADQAVLAYMRPDRESATALLAAHDPQELGKMKALVGEVAQHNQSIIKTRAAAEGELRQKKADSEQAQHLAEAASAQAESELAAVTSRRNQQAVLREEVERRIDHLKSEQAALDQEEAQLQALIAERRRKTEADAAARAGAGAGAGGSTASPGASTSPNLGRVSGSGLIWPTNGTVSSGFGARWGTVHSGLDIAAPTGTPIWAAAAGEVFFAGVMGGYGNAVLIDHGNGMTTLYGHQSRIASSVNQRVGQGQVIGYVGSTGNSTGPHLHFEVRIGDTPRDPAPYLP
jgi:murein DD-endopeptidase MepM/ murein hydrolase activator NlpD